MLEVRLDAARDTSRWGDAGREIGVARVGPDAARHLGGQLRPLAEGLDAANLGGGRLLLEVEIRDELHHRRGEVGEEDGAAEEADEADRHLLVRVAAPPSPVTIKSARSSERTYFAQLGHSIGCCPAASPAACTASHDGRRSAASEADTSHVTQA